MRTRIILFILLLPAVAVAQPASRPLQQALQRYVAINTLRADVLITTEIPTLDIKPVKAQLMYKKPGRMVLKSSGIAILPRLPRQFSWEQLADSTRYMAVEVPAAGQTTLRQVQLIPVADTGELVVARLWLDEQHLPVKSQLTTRSQGTVLMELLYGRAKNLGLPDRVIFTVELQRFKLPKALTMELGRKAGPAAPSGSQGRIIMDFSNYVINRQMNDDELQ